MKKPLYVYVLVLYPGKPDGFVEGVYTSVDAAHGLVSRCFDTRIKLPTLRAVKEGIKFNGAYTDTRIQITRRLVET